MASLYLSSDCDGGKTLTIAPMTNRFAASINALLPDASGYFLVETDKGESEILARVESDDAALKLARLLGLQ